MGNVSVYFAESGDIARAAKLYERQIEVAQRQGNRQMEAIGLGNVGYIYLQLGLFEDGRRALERAQELNEALGALRPHGYNLLNLGLVRWRMGEGWTALHLFEQARSRLEAHGDAFGLGEMHAYKALAQEQLGDVDDASDSYKKAKEMLEEIGLQGFAQDTLAGLARCALVKGDHKEAQKYVSELCDYLDNHEAKNLEFPIQAYQTCANVFEELGDEEKAQDAIKRGYREIISRAEKISDTEWRESFLENVPENLALRERWELIAGTATQE